MTEPDPGTDRLRDLLEQAAPPSSDLSPADRSAAVARRGRAGRRRDRALVGGAAAAVLAVTVAVPLSLRGGDGEGPDVARPAPAPSAAPCPAEPIDVAAPAAVPALGDVVSVRACPAVDGGPALASEPLAGVAAAAFAADVAALPAYTFPARCASMTVAPEPWALVVTVAGGEPVVIGSPMRTCAGVAVAGAERDAGDVLAAFAGNLERQRDGVPELRCPDGDRLAEGADTWNASFDIASATAGMLCYRLDPLGSREYADTEGRLHPETLATIRDDLAAGIGPESGEMYGCIDTGPQRLLVLTDQDGDRAAFLDDRCSGAFTGAHGTWQPSDAAEDAIAAALGGRVSR